MNNRILLIDDDFEVLTVLQMALKHEGYEVKITDDLNQAQLWLRDERFDLVVCDVLMPMENGMDFRERLALTNRNLPPFLFCSGLPMESKTSEGVLGVLMKPFTIQKFLSEIRTHLDNQNSTNWNPIASAP